MCILAGILAFLLLEKYVRSRSSTAECCGESSGHGHSHGHSHGHGHGAEAQSSQAAAPTGKDAISASGWLNLIADAAHNFTDGLAIGASFLLSPTAGMGTTIAILFHELPHEIGDVAMLMQAGFSKWQAILAQFTTAAAALAGCVTALLTTGFDELQNYLLCFTAGGFIYVALVDVFPGLLEHTGLWQTVTEIVALLAGIGFMVIVTLIE